MSDLHVEAAPSGADIMRQFIPNSPYAQYLGIELVEISPDKAKLRLRRAPELATMGTTIHGGAVASLIDTAAMAAAWSDRPPDTLRGATVSLSIAYLAAAADGDLVADAVVLKRGGSLCYLDVLVHADPLGKAIAKGLATYKLG